MASDGVSFAIRLIYSILLHMSTPQDPIYKMGLMTPTLHGGREALKEIMQVKCLAQCPTQATSPGGASLEQCTWDWKEPALRGECLPCSLSPIHARTRP